MDAIAPRTASLKLHGTQTAHDQPQAVDLKGKYKPKRPGK
jgi:hypothetical protein